jgi:hypothetical protein
VIYNLWFSRNKLIFNNNFSSEEDTIQQISTNIHDYQTRDNINKASTCMLPIGAMTHNPRSRNVFWEPPDNNTIKVNTDANLSKEDTWGLSTICRNSVGDVIAAATWCLPGAHDPAAAEAFAIYLAMDLAA